MIMMCHWSGWSLISPPPSEADVLARSPDKLQCMMVCHHSEWLTPQIHGKVVNGPGHCETFQFCNWVATCSLLGWVTWRKIPQVVLRCCAQRTGRHLLLRQRCQCAEQSCRRDWENQTNNYTTINNTKASYISVDQHNTIGALFFVASVRGCIIFE